MRVCEEHGKNVVVVYVSKECPMCELEERIAEYNEQLSELESDNGKED